MAAKLDVEAVIKRVDLDGVVATVDLDAAVARVDLDQIVSRIDIDAIVAGVDLDAVDRPGRRRLDRQAGRSGRERSAQVDLDRRASRRVDWSRSSPGSTSTPLVAKVNLEAVVDRLDIAAVVAKVDPDPIVARVNFDAAMAQIDLIGIAQKIVDGIDLPGIIRDSTGSLASEAVHGVRVQGQHADDAVGQLVGRVFRRRAALDGLAPLSDAGRDSAVTAPGAEHRPAGIVTRVAAMGVDMAVSSSSLGSLVYLAVAGARLVWSPTTFTWPDVPFWVIARGRIRRSPCCT